MGRATPSRPRVAHSVDQPLRRPPDPGTAVAEGRTIRIRITAWRKDGSFQGEESLPRSQRLGGENATVRVGICECLMVG